MSPRVVRLLTPGFYCSQILAARYRGALGLAARKGGAGSSGDLSCASRVTGIASGLRLGPHPSLSGVIRRAGQRVASPELQS